MGCDSFCEQPALFGAIGTCVNSTCFCPEGYNGADDWFVANDCMVSVKIQKLMYSLVFLGFLSCILAGGYSIFFLAKHWAFLGEETLPSMGRKLSRPLSLAPKSPKLGLSPKSSVSMSPGRPQSVVRPTSTKISQSMLRGPADKSQAVSWKRQRGHLIGLVVLMIFPVSGMLYIVPYFAGQYRYEDNGAAAVQNFGLALATPCLLLAIVFITYVSFRSLAPLRAYSELFGIKSYIMENPKVVRNAVITTCALGILFSIISGFVLPLVNENNDGAKYAADSFYLTTVMLLILAIFIFLLQLLVFGRKVLQEMESSSRTTNVSTESIWTLKVTVWVLFFADLVVCPLNFSLVFYLAVARHSVYFFFNLIVILGEIAFLFCMFVLVKFLRGSKVEGSSQPSNSELATNVTTNDSDFTLYRDRRSTQRMISTSSIKL